MPKQNDNKIIKNITFFGDSATPENDTNYQLAFDTAKLLAENGYTIVNGGGPGIMKAATEGAESIDGNTIAIYWEPKQASFFEGKNLANVTDESDTSANYLKRTLGLIEYGDAYVICKGGTGTISEFGMVWCLAKLYYGYHKPVILFGHFWDEIIETFRKNMNIDELELAVLYQASTPQNVLDIVRAHEKKYFHILSENKEIHGEESGFILGGHREDIGKEKTDDTKDYFQLRAGKLSLQEQIDEFMSLVNPPAQVLDLGSGPGIDAGYLATKYSVTGIEQDEDFFNIAKHDNPSVQFLNTNVLDHEFDENKYKGIWAKDILHHIPDNRLDETFSKLSKALVDEGILYVIAREGRGEMIEQQKTTYTKTEKFFHLFSEDELRERGSKVGLTLVKTYKIKITHPRIVAIFKKQV